MGLKNNKMNRETEPCFQCNGSGEGPLDGTFCPVCQGRGKLFKVIDESEEEPSLDDLEKLGDPFRW